MIKSFLYCFRVWQYCHEARTFLRNMESIEDTCVSSLFVRNLQSLFPCCCLFTNGYNFKFGRFALRSTYLLLCCSQQSLQDSTLELPSLESGLLKYCQLWFSLSCKGVTWMEKVKHFPSTFATILEPCPNFTNV